MNYKMMMQGLIEAIFLFALITTMLGLASIVDDGDSNTTRDDTIRSIMTTTTLIIGTFGLIRVIDTVTAALTRSYAIDWSKVLPLLGLLGLLYILALATWWWG